MAHGNVPCVGSKEDYLEDDGSHLSAREVHRYLTRYVRRLAFARCKCLLIHCVRVCGDGVNSVMYNLRSKMDPFWNQLVVAGFDQDKPYVTLTLSLSLSLFGVVLEYGS